MISTNRPASTAATRGGWFKATFSDNAASCVEVRFDAGGVLARSSPHTRGLPTGRRPARRDP